MRVTETTRDPLQMGDPGPEWNRSLLPLSLTVPHRISPFLSEEGSETVKALRHVYIFRVASLLRFSPVCFLRSRTPAREAMNSRLL